MVAVPLLLGALGWSASEYLIHRHIGHGPRRRRRASLLARLSPGGLAAEFNAEHLAHHADPSYFASSAKKAGGALVLLPVVGGALSLLLGRRVALPFTLGYFCAYGAYEVLHRRVHTHPPRGPYGRWRRRHHLSHHHRSPRENHGVSSPLWDLVFSTWTRPERVRVPRHAAPPWLVDAETGEARPEHAADYELVGRRDPAA